MFQLCLIKNLGLRTYVGYVHLNPLNIRETMINEKGAQLCLYVDMHFCLNSGTGSFQM